jgi:hypothetical protein
MARLLAVCALIVCSVLHARAETVEAYLKGSESEKAVDSVWLHGVQNGFVWANVMNIGKGAPALYCQPGHLSITRDQTINILNSYIKNSPVSLMKMDVGMVLLLALQNAFPCPQ